MRLKPLSLRSALLFLGASIGIPFQVQSADVVITSEQQSAEVVAIGFTEIRCVKGDPSSLPYQAGPVLQNDLDFSGRFKLSLAPQFDSTTKTLMKNDGALAYVKGQYTLEGGNFTLDCDIFDIDTQEKILGKKYSGPAKDLRSAVHQFADEMVFQLFGERGIAQSRVSYVAKRSGNKEILVMDYDGFGTREVTHNRSINLAPSFLGQKDRIIFTSYVAGTPQFFVADLTANKTAPFFASKALCITASTNKLDKEVVYASSIDGNSEIYRRAMDGSGKATRLTFSGSIDTSPSWSPNGYEIVFVSDRSGKPMLYVMDRDGANVRRITYEGDYCGSPSWSPKGDRIVFANMDEGNNFSIWIIAPDGQNAQKLTSGNGSNENPTWSPDGRHLAFMSTRTGSPEIWMMRADGSNPRRVSFTGYNSMPAWSDD